jgi:hypothetical protein
MGDQIFEFQQLKERASAIADGVLKSVLDSKKYSAGKTAEWIEKIGATLIGDLKNLSPNFKFIVSTIIIQNTGAGHHSSVSSLWDANTDGGLLAKFDNESLSCICTVIGVAI